MLLSTSENDSVRGTSKNSMWEDAIQTLSLARGALGLDMIMQSKMAMLLLEDWNDPTRQAETSYQQMLRDGLKLWLQRLERSFGDYLRSWTLVRWYDPSLSAEHTLNTDIALFGRPTALRQELWSKENDWQSSVNGLKVILEDIQEEVGDAALAVHSLGMQMRIHVDLRLLDGADTPPLRSGLPRSSSYRPIY